MEVEAKSHIGLVRKANEDSYFLDKEKGIFAVADGMGGLNRGDVASRLALETLAQCIASKESGAVFTAEEIDRAITKINEIVHTKQIQIDQGLMGTTLSLAAINQDKVHIGHVGDSRIYHAGSKGVRLLSEDHSYLAELLRRGEIEEVNLENNSQRNVLMKAIGPEALVEPQVAETEIEAGEYIVLCSDGLYKDLVMEEELIHYAKGQATAKEMVEGLVQKALDQGGQDNITIIVVKYE